VRPRYGCARARAARAARPEPARGRRRAGEANGSVPLRGETARQAPEEEARAEAHARAAELRRAEEAGRRGREDPGEPRAAARAAPGRARDGPRGDRDAQ